MLSTVKLLDGENGFKQAFADVMAGKISVKEAESSIPYGGLIEGDPGTRKALIMARVDELHLQGGWFDDAEKEGGGKEVVVGLGAGGKAFEKRVHAGHHRVR